MRALVAIAVCLVAGSVEAAGQEPDVARGKALVETNCGSCHGLGRSGASSHPQAPPSREVFEKYPPEMLAEALAEGISTGHPDMPSFAAEPDEIAEIIAYLRTLVP